MNEVYDERDGHRDADRRLDSRIGYGRQRPVAKSGGLYSPIIGRRIEPPYLVGQDEITLVYIYSSCRLQILQALDLRWEE